ncbi:MAG TPA: DUF1697 domain-containing protein [Gemmatimonadaceae bacterium]|nr:DUF1697 domain-containing protein [Gemmatimonadaceae bacterium]
MRLFAFLRAINVGGRVVKMVDLKKVFVSLGLEDVETYIASGNVVFRVRGSGDRVPDAARRALENKITAALVKKFKYDHTAFVRTHDEVSAIANYEPFGKAAVAKAKSMNVGFVADAPSVAQKKAILALGTAVDEFHVHGRELYWLAGGGVGKADIPKAKFERAIGGPVTWRNVKTVRGLMEKYPDDSA